MESTVKSGKDIHFQIFVFFLQGVERGIEHGYDALESISMFLNVGCDISNDFFLIPS